MKCVSFKDLKSVQISPPEKKGASFHTSLKRDNKFPGKKFANLKITKRQWKKNIHPGKLYATQKRVGWKMIFLFNWVIFRLFSRELSYFFLSNIDWGQFCHTTPILFSGLYPPNLHFWDTFSILLVRKIWPKKNHHILGVSRSFSKDEELDLQKAIAQTFTLKISVVEGRITWLFNVSFESRDHKLVNDCNPYADV